MKKILALAVSLVISNLAFASDFGVILGLRNDSADSKIAGFDVTAQNNMQLGIIGKFEMSEVLLVRSGFVYVQRNYLDTLKSTSAETILKYSYFEIPIGLMYKFSDFGGAFAGIALSLNQAKSSSTANLEPTGVKSSLMPIQIGASFKFAPQMGAELYYETSSGDIDDNLKDNKAVVVNFMITFE